MVLARLTAFCAGLCRWRLEDVNLKNTALAADCSFGIATAERHLTEPLGFRFDTAITGSPIEETAMPRQTSLKTLEAKIRELQQKAKTLKKREKPGIDQLRKLLTKYRLDLADCKIALSGSPKKRASQLAGRKLKPKYRNPENKSDTWAGRGLKPKWILAAMKSGKKVEDFLIKKI